MGSGVGVRRSCTALVALALVGVAQRSLACSVAPPGWHGSTAASFPADGVVGVDFRCYYECGEAPNPETFVLSDRSGNEVPGTLLLLPGRSTIGGTDRVAFAFKPEANPALGEYTVTVDDGRLMVTVTATPPSPWSVEPELLEEPVALEASSGEPSCCERRPGACGQQPCFYREVVRSTGARISWTWEQPSAAGQYAYRFLSEREPGPPWQLGDWANAPQIEEVASSVCYTLELRRLTDGVVHDYAQRCVERPADLPAIGVSPADREVIDWALRECESPPAGETAEWCAATALICGSNVSEGCATYAELCATGTGGRSGAGGAVNGGGITGGESATGDRLAKGCTCSMPGSRSPTRASLGLLALAAALLGARRRSASRSVRSHPPSANICANDPASRVRCILTINRDH